MVVKFQNKILIGITLFLSLFLLHALTYADNNSPIDLTADTANVDYLHRINTYTGNVHVHNTDSTLDGDKIITYRNTKHQIIKMIDYGNLAHYHTMTDPKNPPLDAYAKIIKFYPLQHHIILIGNGFVQNGDNTMRAPIIHYNTLQKVVRSTATKTERTHIMIDQNGTMRITG